MRSLLRGVAIGALLGALTSVGIAQLSGTYTIDPRGSGLRNFTTFAAAVSTLSTAGVSGPVVFNVAGAVFKEAVLIWPIKGASATNTVSFLAPGKQATLDAGGNASVGLWLEVNCAWLSFRNLRVIGWTQSGVRVDMGAHHNALSRVVVEQPAPGQRSNALLVNGSSAHDNRFAGCTFRNGGISVIHVNGDRNVVTGCEVDGLGSAAYVAGVYNGTGSVLENCLVHSPANTTVVQLGCCLRALSAVIVGNAFLCTSAGAAVHITESGVWSRATIFKNNVVVNLGTGPAAMLVDPANLISMIPRCVVDHNCYYAGNPVRTIEVDDYVPKTSPLFSGSLAAFRTWQNRNPNLIHAGGATSFDLNSIEGDPGLVSIKAPYDIHMKPGSPLIDKGTARIVESYQTQIPSYRNTHDVDGDVRGWKPDIGADEIAARITGSGGSSPGSTHALTLAAPRDGGRTYQVGSAFGTGPIRIGWRPLGLSVDNLLILSAGAQWPHIFPGYRGTLDKSGNGQASIRLPPISALIGQTIHSAFITSDPTAKLGIGAISDTHDLKVTK